MAKLHFSATLLVAFAVAAVWSYPQGSSEPGLPSSPSSSENPQVSDVVNDEKLTDASQYDQLEYDILATSGDESARLKRERFLTIRERKELAARQAARANQVLNAERAAQNRQQLIRQQAAVREAERRNMNNNHRLLNEMENHWNRRN